MNKHEEQESHRQHEHKHKYKHEQDQQNHHQQRQKGQSEWPQTHRCTAPNICCSAPIAWVSTPQFFSSSIVCVILSTVWNACAQTASATPGVS